MQQRHPPRRQRPQRIHRIPHKPHHLLFRKPIRRQRLRPVRLTANSLPSPARPTLHIAHRRLAINAVHQLRMPRRPVVHKQPAPAHPLQRHPLRQTKFLPDMSVKVVPTLHRLRAPKDIRQVEIGDVIPLRQQPLRRLKVKLRKPRPPQPRLARGRHPRQHHIPCHAIHGELPFLETMPIGSHTQARG